jgi:hypothetical protein
MIVHMNCKPQFTFLPHYNRKIQVVIMIYRSLEEELLYPVKRKREPEGSKASRRMRLYWRTVDKENRNRTRRKRPKHCRKRVSVVISQAL